MNRTKFYKKITVNGISELDFLHNTLSLFKIIHTPGYYRVALEDIAEPDLISYKVYDTERYWWIICLVNGIINPLEVNTIAFDQRSIPISIAINDIWRSADTNKYYKAAIIGASEITSGEWELFMPKGLIEGSILSIPDVRDIYDFYKKHAIR